MENVIIFCKEMAWRNIHNYLDTPQTYGIESDADLFDLITGDTAFDDLPIDLQDAIGSTPDLDALSCDLQEAFDTALYVVRSFKCHEFAQRMMSELDEGRA